MRLPVTTTVSIYGYTQPCNGDAPELIITRRDRQTDRQAGRSNKGWTGGPTSTTDLLDNRRQNLADCYKRPTPRLLPNIAKNPPLNLLVFIPNTTDEQ